MDPITLAIVAAVTAGVTAGATEVSKQVIVDAYQGLKTLLQKKFSHQSPELIKAVDELESDPQSKGRAITLAEKVGAAKANEDQEVLAAAQALLDKIKAQPGGSEQVQMIASGSYIAQASHGGTATVSVNKPEEKK